MLLVLFVVVSQHVHMHACLLACLFASLSLPFAFLFSIRKHFVVTRPRRLVRCGSHGRAGLARPLLRSELDVVGGDCGVEAAELLSATIMGEALLEVLESSRA